MNPISVDGMREIVRSAFSEELTLNAGFTILYDDEEGKIGVSLEGGYDGVLGPVYIFNLFYKGEYTNINGQYAKDELLNDELIRDLCNTWNRFAQ